MGGGRGKTGGVRWRGEGGRIELRLLVTETSRNRKKKENRVWLERL